MSVESLPTIEPVPADIMQCPYGILERFRSAGAVHEVIWAHGAKVWLVTGYDEVRTLASHPHVSKDGRRMNELFARHSGLPTEDGDDEQPASVGFHDDLATHMLNTDPPRHTRLRSLVSKAFMSREVERLRPRISQVADQLLDAMSGRSQVDLISDFAVRLPITIICDLFGIPEADRENFRTWGARLVGAGQDPDEVADASKRMVDYANALIDAKRADPGEDMVSALVRVSDDDGDRLTQSEVVAMIFFLVVAGHITTIYSIGNAVYDLLTHPGELAKLRADPALVPAAVDELTRFNPASQVGTFRFTTADISVGDVVIPAGEILALSWSSANRDCSHFGHAERLDINRRPKGSMSFGHGIHHCIGLPLAKMQIEIALTRLISRYPDLRLEVAPEDVRWENSALLRGLAALPVLLRPAG
jgi:cytochrome P450